MENKPDVENKQIEQFLIEEKVNTDPPKKEEENTVIKYYNEYKTRLWDPLPTENKCLCICSSICCLMTGIILFHGIFIVG